METYDNILLQTAIASCRTVAERPQIRADILDPVVAVRIKLSGGCSLGHDVKTTELNRSFKSLAHKDADLVKIGDAFNLLMT